MNVYDIVDVTDIKPNGKVYNGSEKKFGVTINDVQYIMKFRKRNWNNLESEYVASNAIRILGGNAHEVILGKNADDLVVLCKDFTQNAESCYLQSLRSMSSSKFDTERGNYDYYFDDVLHLFGSIHSCDYNTCIDSFCHMFVYDALLGNTDRHAGNWGLLYKDGTWTFAPIFDNGASLFPRASISDVTEEWVKERIYTWPNSKIMFDGKRERASYVDVLNKYDMFDKARASITDELMSRVYTFIDNTSISDDLKSLYKTMLYYRYTCIIQSKNFVWKGSM